MCSLVERGLTSLTDKSRSIANSISQGVGVESGLVEKKNKRERGEEETEKKINIDS